ncbi:hypothetical protein MTO96_029663 [Rhipicephalus appendiculatus]
MSLFGLMCCENLLCSEPLNQIESLGERRGRSEERLIVPSPHRATPTVPVKPSENQTDGFANDSLLDHPSPQSCGSPSEEGPRRKRPRRNSSPAQLAHSIPRTGAAPKGDPDDTSALQAPSESPRFPSPPPSPAPLLPDLMLLSRVLYLPVVPRSDKRTEAEAFVQDIWPC